MQAKFAVPTSVVLCALVPTLRAAPIDEPRSTARAPTAPLVDAATAASNELPKRPERQILIALQYTSRRSLSGDLAPVSELSLPHGLTDADNAAGLFVNTGMLLPHFGGQPTVLTAQLTLEYEPWRAVVSPFVDVGAGGYIVLGRGRQRADAPQVEWLWGSSAGAGFKLYFLRAFELPLAVRTLGQVFWTEDARVPLASVFSGWSLGTGIEYHWDVPNLRVLRQLSHGESMPEGW